ncbi:uncharacterized protein FIBRA_04516 [Fibroporia radiculosa]|uniref:Uncharacterized protein n=1 Tax=Fibroporia radiculosa TaxID=599839 RepID=J4G7I3_9APHY|nr:uncharacterized protein FIBRA_04516 [Fibroporia radiculosa]CCM02418.1 predicted protein [Fibroporia radiculosa]
MAAIVSPRPRLARPPRSIMEPPHIQEKAHVGPHRRAPRSPPRLGSPIDLFDPRAYKSNISKSSTPCSPMKRRRGLTFNPVRSPRRRHCMRTECPLSPLGGPALFDRLPWISQLENSPDSVSAFDIADLSVLAEELSRPQSPRTGPVRHRKSSRFNQLPSIDDFDYFPPHLHELPVYALLPPDRYPPTPRTPPPRETFLPSDIHFQGLRPAFPPGFDDSC